MDTFMDKLAQKLNAQEMIKANAAAEAAELARLREQTAEYEALLNKVKESGEKSIEGAGQISRSATQMAQVTEQISRSAAQVEQGAAQVEHSAAQISTSADKLGQSAEQISQSAAQVEHSARSIENTTAKTGELIAAGIAKIEEIQAAGLDTEALNALLEELKKLQISQNEQLTDHVHKESVKVYRNVQAVIVEETEKFHNGAGKSITKLSGKVGALYGISIAALLVSVAGLVFQILVYLHII